MKTTKIIYWTTTILFAGFMIFSAIPNIMQTAESIQFMTTYLGYPEYIIPFIGVAKLLGSIVILIPGLRRIKEWAYAGLFFDLIGAVYSLITKAGFAPSLSFMFVIIGLACVSYFYNEKVYAIKLNEVPSPQDAL